jgi:competence protein ComEA
VPERSKWTAIAWAAVAAALVFAVARVIGAGGAGAPPPVRVEGSAGATKPRGHAGLYVHVAGAVRRPGLYRIPEGSRVAAALDRAGGPTRRAEVAAVNLAAPLEDGQQVVVPARGAAAPAGTAAPGGPAVPGAQVSLATATVDQLDGLDGIGPTLAERIIAFRDKHGGFRSIEQLREVEGIGEKRFEALKEALRP